MRLRSITGVPRYKNVENRRVDWSGESKSKFQMEVRGLLFPFWKHNVVYEEFPVFGTKLTLDFFNATKFISIEVQGGQHTKFVPYFHQTGRAAFTDQLKNDRIKRIFCEMNDIQLIEIFWEDKKKLNEEFIESLISV